MAHPHFETHAAADTEPTQRELAPHSRLWLLVPLAMAAATIANIVFYFLLTRFLGVRLMFPSQTPTRELTSMPVYDVIVFSLIFSLGAGIVFLLVARLSRSPIRTYIAIATLVLLLSFALPLKIPSPPVAILDKLSLFMMHIVGALAVVSVLIGLGRER